MTRADAVKAAKPARRASVDRPLPDLSPGYLIESTTPYYSLIFVLPLIVLYEVGTRYFATDPTLHTEHRIIAFNLMQDFFRLFHASGKYLPCLAVVGILLTWHIARRDPWHIKPMVLGGMTAESLMLGLPPIGISFALARYLPLAAGAQDIKSLLVLSLGAGVYEELVFRLIALTLLHILLVDWIGMRKSLAMLQMLILSGLLFSAYHYLGEEAFQPQRFVFRTLAGVYFGLVFMIRGFGITAGSHAAYDVLVVTLQMIAARQM